MRFAAVAILLLLATGCSLSEGDDDGNATFSRSGLGRLVLQPEDLPNVFSQFDEGRQIRAEQPSGARSDLSRFGRQDGWKSRYRRAGSPTTRGPLVVESRVDVFKTEGGAKDDLEAIEADQMQEIEKPKLGDDARALTLQQAGIGGGVRFYLIAWREDNMTASVFVSGFEGKITLEDALALARKQQQRIEGATKSTK